MERRNFLTGDYVSLREKRELRKAVFCYLSSYGENIGTKLKNISSKTGAYGVPPELFQKRTNRNNRALISWKTVKKEGFSLEQLNTFEGGVVVELINEDIFDEDNKKIEIFRELMERLGSDENVSAIISIKTEDGSSSSTEARRAYSRLLDNTPLRYRGEEVIINQETYKDYILKQEIKGIGKGNHTWSGFLFISIKGGQQDTIETHKGRGITLFNPACEYASEDVCEDINLVMAYYALLSIKKEDVVDVDTLCNLRVKLESLLGGIRYDNTSYSGVLLDFVRNHYTLKVKEGQLVDSILLKDITIDKFNISFRDNFSLDMAHDEAIVKDNFYWDNAKHCILSAARPTNVFWSYHLANMMQQDLTLDEYFEHEREVYNRRSSLTI